MRLLALSSWNDLRECADCLAAVSYEITRSPETGLVMLRGRIGGTGSAFNMGEATVTRCAVRSAKRHDGHSYIMGRNREHARIAAICDAAMQDDNCSARIESLVLLPLHKILAERRKTAARKAAATKVDFFTLVRGESD